VAQAHKWYHSKGKFEKGKKVPNYIMRQEVNDVLKKAGFSQRNIFLKETG